MIGKTLQNGKYEIKRVLGQGGFGITYEGVQTGLGRKVAIKEFFMKDFCERETGTSQVTIVGTEGNRSLVERFKEKFIKEAQMIAGLEDVPHIIRIYDIFQENGTAYYVMQFIEGGSLDSKIRKEGAVNESIAIGYITQMADALRQLHEHRIMHLDIKPANVLLRGNDLYLIDFGVSKHYDAEGDATTTTPVARSKGYAPIEQYRQGGVQSFSPETDIYSLGATAYFLVTGKTPPEATELIIDPFQRPNGISDSLWDSISTSMSPNKNNRPHSIAEFVNLLNEKDKSPTKEDVSEDVFPKIDWSNTTLATDNTIIENKKTPPLLNGENELAIYCGYTDMGGMPNDEDCLAYDACNGCVIFVVLDGESDDGSGGCLASTTAARTLLDSLRNQLETVPVKDAIITAVKDANTSIFKMSQETPNLKGIRSTLSLLIVNKDAAYIMSIGNSRIYQIREECKLFCSQDPTEFLGLQKDINVSVRKLEYQKKDYFILCTDGVWDSVYETELMKTFFVGEGLNRGVSSIRSLVKENGYANVSLHDNNTMIAVELKCDSEYTNSFFKNFIKFIEPF